MTDVRHSRSPALSETLRVALGKCTACRARLLATVLRILGLIVALSSQICIRRPTHDRRMTGTTLEPPWISCQQALCPKSQVPSSRVLRGSVIPSPPWRESVGPRRHSRRLFSPLCANWAGRAGRLGHGTCRRRNAAGKPGRPQRQGGAGRRGSQRDHETRDSSASVSVPDEIPQSIYDRFVSLRAALTDVTRGSELCCRRVTNEAASIS
jgi:hypothetical protein